MYKLLVTTLLALVLTACGGGGDTNAGTSPFKPETTAGTSGTTGVSTLQVDLSSTIVTASASPIVTLTALTATGQPASGVVIDLSTLRGTLAAPIPTSVMTNSSGVATAALATLASGVEGADYLMAKATIGGAEVQGTKAFSVAAAAPTLTLTASSSGSISYSSAPLTLMATVLDATGAAVKDAEVGFAPKGALLTLSRLTALTDASGRASVTVTAVDAVTSGVETISAQATVGTKVVRSSLGVPVVREVPSVTVSLTSTSVTQAAPATVSALVKNSSGQAVSGTIVTFSTVGKLGAFDRTTAVTDGSGIATATIRPATSSTTGADQVQATATVSGAPSTGLSAVTFVSSSSSAQSSLALALTTTTVTTASPSTATATLLDPSGQAVPGKVVTFRTLRGLGATSVATALTGTDGKASVLLSPVSSTTAGADELVATVDIGGVSLQESKGFQVTATNVTVAFQAAPVGTLSAYGQTNLSLTLTGAGVASPVSMTVTSSCVTQGKATISPATFTTTQSTVTLQYKDQGCGALQASDLIQASVTGSGSSTQLTLPISLPDVSSLAFVSASPEIIYLRGSGFNESSVVTFQVRDASGNPLTNQSVALSLTAGAGGVLLEGKAIGESVSLSSDASGKVSARINSGTIPTPVRVSASIIAGSRTISTVSSNLSVAVGLPSQLNFSLSQATKNIEGFGADGVDNVYTITASDRMGNPVAPGTSINFVAEGGQIESIKSVQTDGSGLSRVSANFVSAAPRPDDGRVTIMAYALGEESFVDLNGNNSYDLSESEPFQDLGSVFLDRNYNGSRDASSGEDLLIQSGTSSNCVTVPASYSSVLKLDTSIPVPSGTCDGRWTGNGSVYVRRSVETILSTSRGRLLWFNPLPNSTGGNLVGVNPLTSCKSSLVYAVTSGSVPLSNDFFPVQATDTWYAGASATTGSVQLLLSDANSVRLNPMASQSTVSVAAVSGEGKSVTASTVTVPNGDGATNVLIQYEFDPAVAAVGAALNVPVTITSTKGTETPYLIRVVRDNQPNPGTTSISVTCP